MMIAQFQEQDRKRQQVVEEKCLPPSPRFVMIAVLMFSFLRATAYML